MSFPALFKHKTDIRVNVLRVILSTHLVATHLSVVRANAQLLTADDVPTIIAQPADEIFRDIKNRIQRFANKRDAAIIRAVTVIVDVENAAFYNVSAVNSLEHGREIRISEGFLEGLSFVNIAAAEFILHDDYAPNQFTDYLDYYSKWLLEAPDKSTGKKSLVKTQCEFKGGTKSGCETRYHDPKFLNTLSGVVYSSYSFILAHELSHHLLHHLDGGATDEAKLNELGDRLNSNQEAAADEYGTRLLVEAGTVADGALGFLGLLAYVQGPSWMGKIQGGYPHPMCRWLDVVGAEIAVLRGNPKISNYFAKLSSEGKHSLAAEEEMLDKIRSEVKECSPQSKERNGSTK